jgi:hypothetical protein
VSRFSTQKAITPLSTRTLVADVARFAASIARIRQWRHDILSSHWALGGLVVGSLAMKTSSSRRLRRIGARAAHVASLTAHEAVPSLPTRTRRAHVARGATSKANAFTAAAAWHMMAFRPLRVRSKQEKNEDVRTETLSDRPRACLPCNERALTACSCVAIVIQP